MIAGSASELARPAREPSGQIPESSNGSGCKGTVAYEGVQQQEDGGGRPSKQAVSIRREGTTSDDWLDSGTWARTVVLQGQVRSRATGAAQSECTSLARVWRGNY